MMEDVATRLLCWQRGLTGCNEARQLVYSHTGESQERGRAEPQAGAGSTASAGVSLPRRHRRPSIGINSCADTAVSAMTAVWSTARKRHDHDDSSPHAEP